MTVSVQPGYDTYVGNDVTTVFAFTFSIFKESDMLVELDGVTQILSLDYTISAIGEGGDVTFITAPGSSVVVTLSGKVPFDRSNDYIANGDFKANEVDTDLDRIVVLCQQLARDFGRSFILPLESLATVDTELPAPIASRFFAWNSGATALVYIDPGSVSLAIPASESVNADKLDSTDLVALRTKLDVYDKASVLSLSGGTMTGGIVLSADGTAVLHPVSVRQLQKGSLDFAITTGIANAYVASFTPANAALTAGMRFFVKIHVECNTTTPTIDIDTLGAKTIKRINGGALSLDAPQTTDLPLNHMAKMIYDGTDMLLLNPAVVIQTALFQDVKPSGGNGGSASATTWNTRIINSTYYNFIGISLSSNQLTIPAGVYLVKAEAPASGTVNAHQIALYNVTDATYSMGGTSEDTGGAGTTKSRLEKKFTLTAQKVFELRHYTVGAQATTGLGVPVNTGSSNEIYSTITFERIG